MTINYYSRLVGLFLNIVPMDKVLLSPDGLKLVVCNQEGLHFFKRSHTKEDFQKVKMNVLGKNGVHSVMMTPSKHVIAHELNSNDLVLFKVDGTEITRHKGYPSSENEEKVEPSRRNSFVGNIQTKIIWIKGHGSLAVVDLQTFGYKELFNSVPYVPKSAEPTVMKIVHDPEAKYICYLFMANKVHCVGVITPISSDPDIYICDERFPPRSL